MTLKERIDGFAKLGKLLTDFIPYLGEQTTIGKESNNSFQEFKTAIIQAEIENPWFIREHLLFALKTLAASLNQNKIEQWIQKYDPSLFEKTIPKTIGVVMAGNLPWVGFHDFICVLMAGHRFAGKLSSEDALLLPAISTILISINSEFEKLISFSKERLSGFDAVIATGSNNSYRYFEYYFGKYPHILRKNRNGIAILTGKETPQQLSGLADDVFLYFGKGCRNVSKIYLPENYNLNLLIDPFSKYQYFFHHHKYMNNYDYYKAILQLSSLSFNDFGFLILREDKAIPSPIAVLNYEFYQDIHHLEMEISLLNDQIQCVVCEEELSSHWIRFGYSQRTELWDYADGIDTMDLLISI